MRTIARAALVALAVFTPSFANAEPVCGDAKHIRENLALSGESEVGVGVVSSDTVMILYASPLGETWSVVEVDTSGRACIVTSGERWASENDIIGDPA